VVITEERHEHEQYFFDAPTRQWFVDHVADFERPCCLCAPTLGRALAQQRADVRVLDIDERYVSGFLHFDVMQPRWLGEAFGVIYPFLMCHDVSWRMRCAC